MIEKDYSVLMLKELEILENLSIEYKSELKLLCKKIRNDMWTEDNLIPLSDTLHMINLFYKVLVDEFNYFDIDLIYDVVIHLGKVGFLICPHLNSDFYNQLIDDIQLENYRKIIEKQWRDINESKDGFKSFKDIFDDFFTQCIDKYKDKFFYPLSENDVLCRAVKEVTDSVKGDRFIPWENKVNNRWNPPGKTYLYLSFSSKDIMLSPELSLNEYICLLECRAKPGEEFFFCNFRPSNKGKILDLSYNDLSVRKIKNNLELYKENLRQKMHDEVERGLHTLDLANINDRKIKRYIRKLNKKNPVNKDVVSETLAMQYLKTVCSCIYKKIDEDDEDKKKFAYKSFHILAMYLEEKGVTGIIYPCTRTNKVVGKNLVLFDKYAAAPIDHSIKKYSVELELS